MNKHIKKVALLLALTFQLLSWTSCGKENAERIRDSRELTEQEYSLYNLAGTDDVGRKITVKDPSEDTRYVGIWYSFWEGQHSLLQPRIRDIQKLLDMGEEGKKILESQDDFACFYYWGEPLYGYYDMRDPYVVTRHIELFTQAGLDFVCVDVTNGYDYLEVGEVFLSTLKKFKDQGFNVPKVCFYTNTNSGTTVNLLYKDYYESGRWEDLWFRPNGKPLIVGITEKNAGASDQTRYLGSRDFVSPAMQRYFEVKESQWPNGISNENGMPWMSWGYEQEILGSYIAVPVAQHDYITTYFSSMSPTSHRGFNNVTRKADGDWREGQSFQQMWDTAHKYKEKISTVFMCCWNEWIAQKQSNGAFIDVYNWEYSRDVEMMKGGYNDNYYMQMVKNVRDFKFSESRHYIHECKTIDINGEFSQFDDVVSRYKDFAGDAVNRNFPDAANETVYLDTSARNDITDVKVVHDSENLYLYVKTADAITEYNGTDLNWMNILIGTNSNEKSFAGYRYIVNRTPSENKTSVERSEGGYKWEKIGEAEYRKEGNEMMFKIPLRLLGLSENDCYVQFKVADHVTKYDDIMDYYVSGDCAPLGRLNYVYGY